MYALNVLATVVDHTTGRVGQVVAVQAGVYRVSFTPKKRGTEPGAEEVLRRRLQLSRYRGEKLYGEKV